MQTDQKHIVFVDDSKDEIETFNRLYKGSRFEITPIHIEKLSQALPTIEKELERKTPPDLFILDLYFAEVDTRPRGLNDKAAALGRIVNIMDSAKKLEGFFSNGEKLLKEAHGVVSQAQEMLNEWCKQLRQSPQGGIDLLKDLKNKYKKTPIIFYTRKATNEDFKNALEAGALDILFKPHPSEEQSKASDLSKKFLDYCDRKPPSWSIGWLEKLSFIFKPYFLTKFVDRSSGDEISQEVGAEIKLEKK